MPLQKRKKSRKTYSRTMVRDRIRVTGYMAWVRISALYIGLMMMMVLFVWQPVGWISLQTKYTQQ